MDLVLPVVLDFHWESWNVSPEIRGDDHTFLAQQEVQRYVVSGVGSTVQLCSGWTSGDALGLSHLVTRCFGQAWKLTTQSPTAA